MRAARGARRVAHGRHAGRARRAARARAARHPGHHAGVAVPAADRPAREALRGVEYVIVDEVHAIAGTKRGAHLALSLERLARADRAAPQRSGCRPRSARCRRSPRFLGGVGEDRAVGLSTPGTSKPLELEVDRPGRGHAAPRRGAPPDDARRTATGRRALASGRRSIRACWSSSGRIGPPWCS